MSEEFDANDTTFDVNRHDDSTEEPCTTSDDNNGTKNFEGEDRIKAPKFIVFRSSLLIVFNICLSCHKVAWIDDIVIKLNGLMISDIKLCGLTICHQVVWIDD